jgi:uncharacterized protein YndB with AHSA1/START domain
MDSVVKSSERMVRIVRVFDAPRALVFDAWSNSEQLLQWFAPNGCTLVCSKIDFQAGGEYHLCIRSADGHECWTRGIYLEIVRPERIVYTVRMANKTGAYITPADCGMHPDWPGEMTVTVSFADAGHGTELTLCQSVSESLAKATGAYPSWLQMLDRLEGLLAGRVVS